MNDRNKNIFETNQPVFGRRDFVKKSLIGSISLSYVPLFANSFSQKTDLTQYTLSLDSPTRLFDGENCWSHPRVGIVPCAGNDGLPRVVLTMNMLDLSGSDVFRGMYGMFTDDLGKTWKQVQELKALAPRYEKIDGIERPVAASDFWPCWHKASEKLLGTGHTVAYTTDWKVSNPRPRNTAYSVYNPENGLWSLWQKLDMPDQEKFYNAGAGCTQRYDLEDGTILLPISFRSASGSSSVTVIRCSFDGKKLNYLEHGDELSIDDQTRGLGEPSLTRFNGEFFMTIRNDKQGFVTRSSDGLHFSPIQSWKFDDGTDLGNYNTQQHWVTHSNGLFLVYTRRGSGNDHVFRHRAPLFIAQVDTEKLCVIRNTEQIIVPERGARLGNFGVTDVSKDETWVTVAEWMQPEGVEKYGSDGSVYIARIHWNKPNHLFK